MIETVSLVTRCDVGQRIIRLLNSSIRLDISYKGKPLLTKIFRKKQALTLKYPGCSLKVTYPHLNFKFKITNIFGLLTQEIRTLLVPLDPKSQGG